MERTIRHMLVLVVVAAAFIGMLFAAAPSIKSVSPVSGFPGTPITITGTGFGATKGTSTVTFNGKPLTVIASWSDTVIKTGIGQAALGPGKLVVTVNGVASNGAVFHVLHRGK